MFRQLEKEFSSFESSRKNFVRMIAESASRAENIKHLLDLNVLSVLRFLLLDNVSSVQQSAALAIGRLANYDQAVAERIVSIGILPDIVNGLSSEDLCYQKHSCFVLRTISKHSSELAEMVVNHDALEPLVSCLQSYDVKVRESAGAALGSIAMHAPDLAKAVLDAQAAPLLITACQDSEPSLKKIAITALGDIAKHSSDMAQALIDENAITIISPYLNDPDSKLRQATALTLSHIAKHSVQSAELVVNSGIFPAVLLCFKDKDQVVRKNAAGLIREVVKHTQELSQRVVTEGGGAALVQFLKPDQNNEPLFGVMSIGYIASFSQALSSVLIQCGAPEVVLNVFVQSKSDQTKSAAAWALGQLGKHTSDTSSNLSNLQVLSLLLEEHNKTESSIDLKQKTEKAMYLIIQKCTNIEALQCLIDKAPQTILEYVLEQISKLIPKNLKMRVPFIQSGGFAAVQRVQTSVGTKIKEYVDIINGCYPEQAVKYYSPQCNGALIQEIENYGH